MSHPPEQNREIVRSVFEDYINRKQVDALPRLFAEEYVGGAGERGPSGFATSLGALTKAFPDIHYTVEDLVAEGNQVAVRWKWQGTHLGPFRGYPASHKQVTSTGMAFFELRDGKIVRGWLETDRLGFLQGIGVVPAGIGAGPSPGQTR